VYREQRLVVHSKFQNSEFRILLLNFNGNLNKCGVRKIGFSFRNNVTCGVGIKAVLMGTRRGDPHGSSITAFEPSSFKCVIINDNWPKCFDTFFVLNFYFLFRYLSYRFGGCLLFIYI
jgi:hypothetical protein